eukprot:GHUV01041538.1.p1 GENE.GHUV01041538.1~~GHUV01041538.1.p1  ORF type:complete len:165 (-),score=18.77 GHUV01041538.1:11-505(-)
MAMAVDVALAQSYETHASHQSPSLTLTTLDISTLSAASSSSLLRSSTCFWLLSANNWVLVWMASSRSWCSFDTCRKHKTHVSASCLFSLCHTGPLYAIYIRSPSPQIAAITKHTEPTLHLAKQVSKQTTGWKVSKPKQQQWEPTRIVRSLDNACQASRSSCTSA